MIKCHIFPNIVVPLSVKGQLIENEILSQCRLAVCVSDIMQLFNVYSGLHSAESYLDNAAITFTNLHCLSKSALLWLIFTASNL